ncbi:MAG: head-tail connector protein [Hyphomicrobiaceae bacterium]
MAWSLSLVTAPSAEPVTLAEAKAHLRVEPDEMEADNLIRSLIASARAHVENETGRALMAQTWDLRLDCWPITGYITLPKPPLQSVTHVKYYDTAGVQQTWSPALYQVANGLPPRLAPIDGEVFPTLATMKLNAIEVRFVAGYVSAELVPEPIRQAIKLLVGHWYEFREEVVVGAAVNSIPSGVAALLFTHRVWSFV